MSKPYTPTCKTLNWPAYRAIVAPLVRATLPSRQTTGFVERLPGLIGLNWTVPDFSTLSRRQQTLAVNIPHRGLKGPLHLLIA